MQTFNKNSNGGRNLSNGPSLVLASSEMSLLWLFIYQFEQQGIIKVKWPEYPNIFNCFDPELVLSQKSIRPEIISPEVRLTSMNLMLGTLMNERLTFLMGNKKFRDSAGFFSHL